MPIKDTKNQFVPVVPGKGAFSRQPKRLLMAAMMPALALASAPSLAQSGAVLEEVLVTARKREESAQDVPIAITSMSGDALKLQGAAKVIDIAFHVPNMMYTESVGNNTSLRTTIRGQTQNDIIGTLDASIGTYVDDIIWSRPVGSNVNLADIERVEVLRGPQGTLFGRNTTGGAVQIYTKNPEFIRSARIGGTIGNYSRADYNLMVNTPIIDDKLAGRIAVDGQKRDGWQDNVIGGYDVNQDDKRSIIAKLLFTPSERSEFLLKVQKSEGDYRGNGSTLTHVIPSPLLASLGFPPALQDPYLGFPVLNPATGPGVPSSSVLRPNEFEELFEGAKPHTWFDSDAISLTSSIELSDDLSMKLILGYRGLEYATFFDLDGSPVRILETETRLDGHDQYSAELLFSGTGLEDKLDWTVGLYHFDESGTDGSDSFSPFGFITATEGDVENTSQAVFAQGTYRLTEQLNLTLGLRYSEESKDLTSVNARETQAGAFISCLVPEALRNDPSVPGRAGCVGDFSRDDDSIDYTFMVDYSFDSGLMAYFKTATGFRSGGQNLRGTDLLSFTSFAPEEVEEFEVGFKHDWLDSRLRTNMAFFYSDYSDIQRSTIVPVAGGATATVVANAASATVKGLEAEFSAILTDAWQAGGSFGWTDAGYDDYMDIDPATGGPLDRSGQEFVSTPEHTYSLWTQYSLPLTTGSLDLRADYSWHDEYVSFSTLDPTGSDTPAKGMINARAQWNVSDKLELALWGKNLTDEQYRIAGIDFFGNFGHAIGVGNEPRTYGLDVNYYLGE